jgi:trk system potassium uptake protein TrkA
LLELTMRVVILGAGIVGRGIAEFLCMERHSVTVVESNVERAHEIKEDLDVRVVVGSASQSTTLREAEVSGADLVMAVTGEEEVNILAASMAKAMGARRTIARVYARVFQDPSTFDYQGHFGIDRLLSLEELSALELAQEIRNPGSVMVEHFARGEMTVQEAVLAEKSNLAGTLVKQLDLSDDVRIGSISRKDEIWIAQPEDELEEGDRILLIGNREDVERLRETIEKDSGPKKGVMIAGGGEIGVHLAQALEGSHFDVVLMEQSKEKSERLSNELPHVTVICGDATRRVTLEEERVGNADVFVACIGDDESNMLAGAEAKDIGAKKILCVVNRPDYVNLMEKLGIDVAISPRQAMARQIRTFLNTGPVVSRTMLHNKNIGVFEIEVQAGSPATEHVLANLDLPAGKCLIAARGHDGKVILPRADEKFEAGDLVVALIDISSVEKTLEKFSVGGI